MALLKWDGYQEIRIVTGDNDFDTEHEKELVITAKELCSALNAEQVTDRLVRRILAKRTRDHEEMLSKIPGAVDGGGE